MEPRAVAAAWAAGGLAASTVVLGSACAGWPTEVGIVCGCVAGVAVFLGTAVGLDRR